MKRLGRILFGIGVIAILFSWSSCSNRSSSVMGLQVTGKVGEILVVCESDIWNSEVKNELDTGLTQFILPYLPDLVTFELVHRTPRKFEDGIKRFRNILFVNIDPDYEGEYGKIEMRDDVWAHSQLVIDIIGKDLKQVLETCQLGLDDVHKKFDRRDWKRIMDNFDRNPNSGSDKVLADNFGIKLALPDGAKVVNSRTNFARLEFPNSSRPIDLGSGGQDAGTIFTGIMVYQYDFSDSSQLNLKNLLMARDTMLRYNVPSEIEGMYMGTQYVDYVYPEGNDIANASGKINGYEMRGMFKFLGNGSAGTGGAFWAFHFVHPKKKKLMCISGYVDAPPTTSWTHPLREIQAVIRSVEFTK
jgi:hypothetical protein